MTRVCQISGRDGRGARAPDRDHQRPLNRHTWFRAGEAGPLTTARGHSASAAARIAAHSSSVGTGRTEVWALAVSDIVVTLAPGQALGGAVTSSSIDHDARAGRVTTVPAILSWKVRRWGSANATRNPMKKMIETVNRRT